MGCSLMKKYSNFSKSEDWTNPVAIRLIVVVETTVAIVEVPSVRRIVLTTAPIVT